mmetsp:Transcript_24351/g.53216  ORF Transcript_24351/g.53216 Transcript_24351/m.53216 type:complete len:80 (-) Transcript_24351:346-585(-)
MSWQQAAGGGQGTLTGRQLEVHPYLHRYRQTGGAKVPEKVSSWALRLAAGCLDQRSCRQQPQGSARSSAQQRSNGQRSG